MSEASGIHPLPGIGLTNYRSFGADGFILDNPKKVNVLIGKNNTGKSNVLRAIQLLSKLEGTRLPRKTINPTLDKHRREDAPPIIITRFPWRRLLVPQDKQAEWILGEVEKTAGPTIEVRWNASDGKAAPSTTLAKLEVRPLSLLLAKFSNQRFTNPPNTPDPYRLALVESLAPTAAQALHRCLERLLVVPVFRQVRSGGGRAEGEADFDGHGVIDALRDMQHPGVGEDAKRQVFDKLTRFARDLIGVGDLTLEVPAKGDHVIVNMHGNRLPLDSYGTGVHHLVILCAALASHTDKVVTIEEPEIHLHPELQRKFLRFIAAETSNTYILTTHSNAFLDTLPDVSVYHVGFGGAVTTVEPVGTPAAARAVLADMGYKASDLLQANGIIWVEGPSDRIYLNRWLSLVAPELVEGIHYAVTFYGGKVLTHFTAADDPVEDLVQVLRINRHAVVMVDRDGDDGATPLNANKQRIQAELGPAGCWVTQGREVENYVPIALIRRVLGEKFPAVSTVDFGEDQSLDEVLTGMDGGPKRYDKVAYARRFADAMTEPDLDVLDLRQRVTDLVKLITDWNRMG